MKKIININLFAILLGCSICVLKLSIVPLPIFLQNTLLNILETDFKICQTYSIYYDFSLCFIISYIFYLITTIVPNLYKFFRVRKLIKPSINNLLRYLETLISILLSYCDIETTIDKVEEKNLLKINGVKFNDKKTIWYNSKIFYTNQKQKTGETTFNEFSELIQNIIKSIYTTLEDIEKFEPTYYSDVDFFEIIHLIRKSSFLSSYYQHGKQTKEIYYFIFSHTSKDLYNLIDMYRRLLKCKYHDEFSITNLLSDEEIKKRPRILDVLKSISNLQSSFENLSIIIVYNSQDNNSKILSPEIANRVYGKYIDISQDYNCSIITKAKYIIILNENKTSNSKNLFKSFITHNELSNKNIIIVKPYYIYKWKNSTLNSLLINKNANICETYYYKSDFKLFNKLKINKKSPTPYEIDTITTNIYNEIKHSIM